MFELEDFDLDDEVNLFYIFIVTYIIKTILILKLDSCHMC